MQVGGGITPTNAFRYLDAGASHIIITSYIFRDAQLDAARLKELVRFIPPPVPSNKLYHSIIVWSDDAKNDLINL